MTPKWLTQIDQELIRDDQPPIENILLQFGIISSVDRDEVRENWSLLGWSTETRDLFLRLLYLTYQQSAQRNRQCKGGVYLWCDGWKALRNNRATYEDFGTKYPTTDKIKWLKDNNLLEATKIKSHIWKEVLARGMESKSNR
jgi:hypothetical protein